MKPERHSEIVFLVIVAAAAVLGAFAVGVIVALLTR